MERKRRLIDEKGRIFGVVNILDIFIVAIVVMVIAAIFSRGEAIIPKKDTLIATFYIEEAPDFAVDAINNGDPVTEATFSSSVGKVTGKETGPSVSWARSLDGEVKKSTKDGYSYAYVTMECEGVFNSDGSFTIDKSKYFVGQTITLNVGNSRLENGRFSSIVKKDG